MARTETTPRIGLADAIAELRSELSRARRQGEGSDIRFAAKAIEIELAIDFTWSAEGTVGVAKWIPFVDLSAKGGASEKSGHKLKLTLEIAKDGTPAGELISDADGPARKPAPGS
jgi:Trypsin-co-occurring domain 2